MRIKFFTAAALAASLLAAGGSAGAATYTSLLEYQNGATGVADPSPNGPFGIVTLYELTDGKTVQVTVHLLNDGSKFINTGGPHDPFLFNTTSDGQVTILPPVGSFVDGGHGSFEATPFGSFTDKIGCCLYKGDVSAPDLYRADVYDWNYYTEKTYSYTYYAADVWNGGHTKILHHAGDVQTKTLIGNKGDPIPGTWHVIHHAGDVIPGKTHVSNKAGDEQNGAAAGQLGDLIFTVYSDAGMNFINGPGDNFTSNAGGWWFSADIFDTGTGLTYNVAARDADCIALCSVTPVPEPDSWALMILGFGGLGAMLRSRHRSLASGA